jgi:hypothetical protein
MAISITWATKVINVPKADLTLVDAGPPEIRELDLNVFRLALKDLEDDEDGMPFLHTHNHVPPITVGTITLARVVELINGYTVTFEDGQYAVDVVGANTNLGTEVNKNQVSVFINNSTGLTDGTVISTKLTDIHRLHALDNTRTLEVTDISRKTKLGAATEIDQTISDDGVTTTVTRIDT